MDLRAAELLATLRGRGIVTASAYEAVAGADRSSSPPDGSDDPVRYLLERGDLTDFQADRIGAGRIDELTVGSYVLRDLLGSGGMGRVFRAWHPAMEREVALKVIRDNKVDSDGVVRRFRREAVAAARLAHPNVVTAHDAGEVDGVLYFVMELVVGTDLATRVRERGPMDVPSACDAARQAALGLQHIGERGHVHRDVKPSNLLRADADGTVKVADLGLARRGEDEPEGTTPDGLVIGTPDYLAPEAAEDPRRADARSDVYGLGCTLYHLLTGSPPFPGGTAMEKVLRHREALPVPLESRRADLPVGLAAVVGRMMARRPDDRFTSPGEAATALAPFAVAAGSAGLRPSAPDGLLSALVGPPPKGGGYAGGIAGLVGLAAIGLLAWAVGRGAGTSAPARGEPAGLLVAKRTLPGPAPAPAPRPAPPPDVVHARELTDRGYELIRAGDFEAAKAAFDEAIGADSTNPRAYNGRGICHQRRRRFDPALADFTEAARRAEDPSKYLANRGETRRLSGRLDLAEADFDEAIRLRPGNGYCYRSRGMIRLERDDLDAASADLDEAIRIDPGDRAAFQLRAGLHDRLGDRGAADADRREAARLGRAP